MKKYRFRFTKEAPSSPGIREAEALAGDGFVLSGSLVLSGTRKSNGFDSQYVSFYHSSRRWRQARNERGFSKTTQLLLVTVAR